MGDLKWIRLPLPNLRTTVEFKELQTGHWAEITRVP